MLVTIVSSRDAITTQSPENISVYEGLNSKEASSSLCWGGCCYFLSVLPAPLLPLPAAISVLDKETYLILYLFFNSF